MATLEEILSWEERIIQSSAKLLVMPEGRERFRKYFVNAVEVPCPETDALAGLSARTGASLVVGCIERTPHSLFCTALFVDPQVGLVGKHRKLTERLIWGMSDGSTLPVVQTAAGKVSAAICWENHMPLLRAYMYAKGTEIYCAPTVDCRDHWEHSMRHIGHEGRCFVVTACQFEPSPRTLGITVPHWDDDTDLIRGGSLIVGPQGELLAGPLFHEAGLVCAEIDTDDITRARYDLDVSGHYARPDVFSLHVDTRAKSVLEECTTGATEAPDP